MYVRKGCSQPRSQPRTWWELAWCIWTLWLNPCAKMTGTIYVSNFLPGVVAQPALIALSLVFLHRLEDCTFSSELGFSGFCSQHRWCESPVLLMHAHGAGSILRKSCTLCQPRSAGCSSSQGLISEFAERWRCAGRKETQHTPAGGEWRLIKSMGFLWSSFFFFLSSTGNLIVFSDCVCGTGVIKWWSMSLNSKTLYSTVAPRRAGTIHQEMCLCFNHKEVHSHQQWQGHNRSKKGKQQDVRILLKPEFIGDDVIQKSCHRIICCFF